MSLGFCIVIHHPNQKLSMDRVVIVTVHLTSTERRHLRAMHELGHKQLQNANYVQAIEVFSEILRGQKERHGKRS